MRPRAEKPIGTADTAAGGGRRGPARQFFFRRLLGLLALALAALTAALALLLRSSGLLRVLVMRRRTGSSWGLSLSCTVHATTTLVAPPLAALAAFPAALRLALLRGLLALLRGLLPISLSAASATAPLWLSPWFGLRLGHRRTLGRFAFGRRLTFGTLQEP